MNIKPKMNYASALLTEWQQCLDEGYDVADFHDLCADVERRGTEWDDIADGITSQMLARPMRADYPYEEPSDYEKLLAARPTKRHMLTPPAADVLEEKLRGAWSGRISGCLLGKPVEGKRIPQFYQILKTTDNYPLHRYMKKSEFSEELIKEADIYLDHTWADNIGGIAPVDDDTNYTVFGLRLIEDYGKNFKADDVMSGWHRLIPFADVYTAEDVAYRNGTIGLRAPESAMYRNPYREWIGAQIRGDFFGYINPGDPEAAAAMAFRDASISHIKNGIYVEMFCSAMIAAAAVTDDIMMIIEAGLDEIPAKCRLRADIEKVIAWYGEGLDREAIIAKIHETYDENPLHGWCHVIANAMIVVMALLTGEGDFGKSVCAAVQAAFDTDCNGATVGSIIGMRNGISGIPTYWTEPWGGRLRTSIQGYNNVSLDELVAKTLTLIKA